MHDRSNFWYLIMASIKLIQYVYVWSLFVIKIYKNIYFNFLFELPKGMSLIGSYLVPSFSLVVSLEKILFIKKVYSELNYKIYLRRDLARGRKISSGPVKLHILTYLL